ncbi:unnamed protein product [Microthlaspi erraticum]|uniref:Uncharacterized protein n=1 Tax=Microthlaspi erraticum TaxID=1685480 RepID=A0A6D2IE77_9BRAS|nr:unnamed protein product [Microthlaspi erraticum]
MRNGGVMGQDAFMSIDEKEGLRDKDEVMIRRMKNRERQRRYRARKRMREEAGIDENLSFETITRQQQEDEEEEEGEEEEEEKEFNNGYVENFVRRVYCHRDWKKEARRAHLMTDKTQGGYCESKRKIWPRRRDWKAEARKKKT